MSSLHSVAVIKHDQEQFREERIYMDDRLQPPLLDAKARLWRQELKQTEQRNVAYQLAFHGLLSWLP